jgi:exopolyphosphatase/guanosine-5'-triphosphate,3'-diphosphate pyrophosphatase
MSRSKEKSSDSLVQHAESIMQRLERELRHVKHVAKQAKKLALALQEKGIEIKDEALGVLEAAALLHDIGWNECPDGKGHHKASARMILDETWPEACAPFVFSVAAVARYHRKRGPREGDVLISQLDHEEKLWVAKMAGILRLADALDRRHLQLWHIDHIELIDNAMITVWVIGKKPWKLDEEQKAWEKKKDVAETAWRARWILKRA